MSDTPASIEALYSAYHRLTADGWIAETVAVSARRGMAQPILSFKTKAVGPALWILSGIHGEEPAGPNALAEGIDVIRDIGRHMPVVLLPLCNPLGYVSGWRYLDRPDWQEGVEACSVGDSEHVLRGAAPSSPEASALVAQVLKLSATHPPVITADFHEDSLLDEGYVYSQGSLATQDPVALAAIEALRTSGIALRMSGKTRFGEEIAAGVVGPQADGSIDELLAAQSIIIDGKPAKGPGAQTVLVIETPAAMPLPQRTAAHIAVLSRLRDIASRRAAA
ncbi:MAG: hypothetical protein ACAH80_05005 [Alphaproteobacteria bacterium]